MNGAARGFLVGIALLFAAFAILSFRDCQARGDVPPVGERYPASMCWCDNPMSPSKCWCRLDADGGWDDAPAAVDELRAQRR